jgi:tRNA(Ile)-lysidine synthase
VEPLGPLSAGRPRPVLVDTVCVALDHLDADATVVVACSGGPDSSALAYLVAEARPDLAVTLGHVRHGLRDDTADVAVVRQHAAWLGVSLELRDVEVARAGAGLAAAARDARSAALDAIAAEVRATSVLLGHTADDQAETVLLRLARGTGTDGLAAMAAVADGRSRPLLRLRRADLRGFLDAEGLPYVDDPSNRDPASRRARVRHEVLPALARVGPDPVAALARTAAIVAGDRQVLDAAVDDLRAQVRHVGPVAAVPEPALAAAAAPTARRLVRDLVAAVTGRPPSAASLARALSPRGASLPGGVEVTVAGGWRTVAPRDEVAPEPVTLRVPGTTRWPAAALVVRAVTAQDAEVVDDDPAQAALPLPGVWRPPRVRVPAAVVPPGGHAARASVVLPDGLGPLRLRARHAGDRLRTAVGTARLADVLIDAGVPRAVRDRWPLVVADDRLVWVPGVAVDAELAAAGRRDPGLQLVLGHGGRRATSGRWAGH